MKAVNFVLFLTLVLFTFTGFAQDEDLIIDTKDLNLNSRQELTASEGSRIFLYDQSMSPRLILSFDLKDLTNIDYGFGINYMFASQSSKHIEIGADFLTKDIGFFRVGQKNIFYKKQSFRPFIKYGVALSTHAGEQLAGIVNYENYFLNFTVGLEDLLKIPMSVRIETEVYISSNQSYWFNVLSYSWAW
ncbi:MAG: hypothetical protein MK008_00635 [Bdellovibrionales bacterium]|nr:hypothetical protein [Bdellovibrionales bacterium]